MTKRAQRKLASFLLIIQLFFSFFASFSPFVGRLTAQDQTSSAEFSTQSLGFSAENNQLIVKSDQDQLDYSYYYMEAGVPQAAEGQLSAGENALFVGIQSAEEFVEHAFEQMVFKAQRNGQTYAYYLQNQDDQLVVAQILFAQSLELSADEQNWLEAAAETDWLTNEETMTAVTAENVELDVEYVFPFNDKVSVVFTRLPEETSTLTIREVVLSVELAEKYGTEVAYDITTDMENGEFEFDLSLPKPNSIEGAKVEVVYADNEEELADDDKVGRVETERDGEQLLEVDEEEGVVRARKVEHLTVFVVVDKNLSSGSFETSFSTSETAFTIDNGEDGYEEIAGDWINSSAACSQDAINNDGRYSTDAHAKATYTFQVPVDGNYRIYAHWISYSTQTNRALYYSSSNFDTVFQTEVDQQEGANCAPSDWIELGESSLVKGEDYVVTLSNAAESGNLYADAIKVVLAEEVDTYWVNDGWQGSNDGDLVGDDYIFGHNAFGYIQDAIDAASDENTINVKTGTYFEQLVVDKDVTLIGLDNPMIEAPASRTSRTISGGSDRVYDWVVLVEDVDNFEFSGFVINGGEDVGPIRYVGILVGNSKGAINNNEVENIRGTEGGTGGIIVVGEDSVVDIEGNKVSDFRKNGITANLGSTANIIDNVVIGDGRIDTIAQNGIQIGFGATGQIINNAVSDIWYDAPGWSSVGILVINASDVLVEDNTVYNSQSGITASPREWETMDNIIIRGNEVRDCESGIYNGWQGFFTGQRLIENNQLFDNYRGISLYDAEGWTINGNTVDNSTTRGIGVLGAASDNTIEHNILTNNDIGIVVGNDGFGDPDGTIVQFNNIFNNINFGLEVLDFGDPNTVDARNNWWGDVSGPYHESQNPQGLGGAVSDNVDFCPWLDAEDGESFGFCIDEANPEMSSIFYFKNGSPITVVGTGEDPLYVQNPGQIEYSAEFSDDLKLGHHVFAIYDEHPDNPGRPHWTSQGGKAYCSFNGTDNRYELSGQNDEVNNVSLSDCSTDLEDGRYVVVNRVYDAVGKFSESYNLTFVVGTVPPSAPTGITIFDHAGNELGCNGYTNNRNIRIDWNDNPESDIAYYRFDIKDKDDHVRPVDSHYDARIRNTDDYYKYRVWAVDHAGNQSEESSDWCGVTLDREAPSIPTNLRYETLDGKLLSCSSYTNEYNIFTKWNESNDNSGILGYEYRSFNPPTGWKWGTPFVKTTHRKGAFTAGEGTYGFKVRAVDLAGNKSDWTAADLNSSCQITYDVIDPVVSITSHQTNDFLNGEETITGEIVEENISHYNLSLYEVEGESCNPELTWDFDKRIWQKQVSGSTQVQHVLDTLNFADGHYMIRLAARDLAGNRDPMPNTGEGVSVEVICIAIDNTAPIVSEIDILKDGQPAQFIKTGDEIVIRANVTDNLSGVKAVSADFSFNSAYSNRPSPRNTRMHHVEGDVYEAVYTVPGNWDQGSIFITVAARDHLDNYIPNRNLAQEIVVDNTTPQSTITFPENEGSFDTVYLNDWDGTIAGTATDPEEDGRPASGVEYVQVAIQRDSDSQYWNSEANEGAGQWQSDPYYYNPTNPTAEDFATWEFDNFSPVEGVYNISSHATDRAGNTEESYSITVVYDKTIPEVDISIDPADPDGAGNWYITRPTATLTASDNFEVDYIQYRWGSDGSWNTYTTPLDAPSEGRNVLYYRAVDMAGNISEEGIKNIRWDETDLTEGPLNVKADPNPTSGTTSTISWDAATDNVGIARYRVTWDLRDGDDRRSKNVGSTVRETTIDDLQEGTYKVTVRAYDNSGFNKSASTDLVVNRTAPAAPTLTLEEVRDGEVDLSWNEVEDAVDYIILYGLESGDYIYAARVGNITEFTVEGLTAGAYYFVVRAVDNVDNQSANSNEVSSGIILGAVGLGEGIGGPAAGFEEVGEVLGEETEEVDELDLDADDLLVDDLTGEVLGETDTCGLLGNNLPWILLGLQALILLAVEILQRRGQSGIKLMAAVGVTLVTAGLYYLLRSTGCFAEGSITMLINNWYWLAAILLAVLIRATGYGFIEETEL